MQMDTKSSKDMNKEKIKYEIVRSRRKTLSIEIKRNGTVLIRAPYALPNVEITKFLQEKEAWIMDHVAKARIRSGELSELVPITMNEVRTLAEDAVKWVPSRVNEYARMLGITYGQITIRNQRTRWGSCSSKGNLNFNCLMMLFPEDVRDYIIIHELCHRIHMNHSKAFWGLVATADPDYKKHEAYLKREGEKIMLRAFGDR